MAPIRGTCCIYSGFILQGKAREMHASISSPLTERKIALEFLR